MYKILFSIAILLLSLLPAEATYSQELSDSQIEQNLEHLYTEGVRQMNSSQLTKALMTFKKILYYERGYKDTEELFRKVRSARESLTKTTVTSPTPDGRRTGLRIYKPKKCYDGYTLFAHRTLDLPGVGIPFPVYLIDMNGNIVYQWMVGGDTALARLKPNGNLAYITGGSLREVDPRGNIVWRYPGEIDHSFQCLEDGSFLINRNEWSNERGTDGYHTELPHIELISSDKKILWQWKGAKHIDELGKLIGHRIVLSGWWANNNHSEILKDNPLSRKDSRFRKGNVLFCYNALSLIGIIDYGTGKVVWAWPWGIDVIELPHAPTMLDNGHILIFDNGGSGSKRPWSRVIELNPLTEEIVWEYHAEPRESFFSPTMGGATRLANGNTLICEATKNRIFEITPTGEIVWDFISTFNKAAGTEYIYQAFRYSPAYVRPLLKRIKDLQKR